jgi:hypothetical protein
MINKYMEMIFRFVVKRNLKNKYGVAEPEIRNNVNWPHGHLLLVLFLWQWLAFYIMNVHVFGGDSKIWFLNEKYAYPVKLPFLIFLYSFLPYSLFYIQYKYKVNFSSTGICMDDGSNSEKIYNAFWNIIWGTMFFTGIVGPYFPYLRMIFRSIE